jgi:ATP-binding cassette subfamily B protein/subfamily B ATP-binding cassette protein MsbA
MGLLAMLAPMHLKIGLDLLKPWPVKLLVDNVLDTKPLPAVVTQAFALAGASVTRESLLALAVAGTVLLFLAGWAIGLASTYASINFAQRMVYDLAQDMFAHLQRLSLRFHSRKTLGDSIRRVTTDSACVSTLVKDALLPAVAAVVTLVLMFGIMWQLDAGLTVLSLAVVPFMALVFRRYSEPMLQRSYAQQEAEGRMYDVVEQTLSAIPVVQAFGQEERADRALRENVDTIMRTTLSSTAAQLKFKILMRTATALGTAAILWVGAVHALDGTLSIGSVLVFLSYLGSLYTPLETLAYTTATVQDAAASGRRVMEILETEAEVKSKPGAHRLERVKGEILLDNVTFGYDTDVPVLSQFTLYIEPGQTVAVVGATGAGKSTLAALITRLFDPWSGSVLIDGYDIRDVQLSSLREQVALVLQEPFLFPISIAQNIAYGSPHATQQQIEQAARAARAHNFIVQLPDGYDTVIGERGATLSGGEKQRVAIARALLKDAPILILDEPTSALDGKTEGELVEGIESLKKGRTTLIIAHRLSTIRNADRIVVMDKGKIAEVGSHSELLRLGKVYANLYSAQSPGQIAASVGGTR